MQQSIFGTQPNMTFELEIIYKGLFKHRQKISYLAKINKLKN